MAFLAATGMIVLLGSSLEQPRPANPPAPVRLPTPEPEPEPATIVVTGTRIVAPNRQSASPVETVRPEEFTLTGVANVEQTLNQLPQIAGGFTTTSNNPGTGAATLDLRGLGSVRTLILVNGRRWIANDAGQIPEIDVNTIPAALIERVDIVTGGASAVYGSDAVTGVINFILKKGLKGLHLDARNAITEQGDGRVSSADLTYGASFLGGRGKLLVSGGWLDQRPILQVARDHTRFTLSDGCVIGGTRTEFGFDTAAPPGPCGDQPGEELGYVRGGSFIIPQGLIGGGGPILFAGVDDRLVGGGPVRFAPDGSLVRFFAPTDSYNFAADNYLQVPLARISANALGSIAISDRFEPYAELSYIRTRSPQQLAPAAALLGTGTGTVPRARINLDNPFLSDQARDVLETSYGVDAEGKRGFLFSPATGFRRNPAFGGDADGIVQLPGIFRTRLTGLGPRQLRSERNAYRALGGIRGALSRAFDYDVYFSASDVKHDNPLVNSASASRLQQALLARADPATGRIACIDPGGGCVPINIFGVQDISAEAADFIRADPAEQTRVREQVAEAVVKGIAAELPAGPVRTAGGVNWRRTSYVFTPDRSLEEGDNLGFNPSVGAAGRTSVVELFGEALVPLVSDRPLARELSAELGLRYSHYDSVGGVWTWKAMGFWAPVRALRFRGGLQQAVRAPNVRELFEEPTIAAGGIADPCAPSFGLLDDPAFAAACVRNGASGLSPDEELFFPLETRSGSRDLEAETARTLTLGLVAQPLSGLNLTVDYYDIDIRDAIGTFGGGGQFTVFGCIQGGGDPDDPLCRAYRRAPSGEITDIDLPTANLSRLRARGVDWQAAYGFPLLAGAIRINLSGTRLLSSRIKLNPNVDAIDCGGAFGGICGVTIGGSATPKWKLFNRLGWASGPVTLSMRHRYFSSTRNSRFDSAEALGFPPPTNLPSRAHRLESRHYFDLASSFAIRDRFGLTLGVNNLANRKPSLLGSQQIQANTDPSLYDVIGRRFFVAVSARY